MNVHALLQVLVAMENSKAEVLGCSGPAGAVRAQDERMVGTAGCMTAWRPK